MQDNHAYVSDPLEALETADREARKRDAGFSPGHEAVTMLGRQTTERLIAELRASRKVVEAARYHEHTASAWQTISLPVGTCSICEALAELMDTGT